MKTEQQIQNKIDVLQLRLSDALEHNFGDWDAEALQTALHELNWVLK